MGSTQVSMGSIHVCECDQHTGHHVSECIECFLQRFRTLFRNFAIIQHFHNVLRAIERCSTYILFKLTE